MAYGAKGERNGVHRQGKKHHGLWLEDGDWNGLKAVSASVGLTVTGLCSSIGRGEAEVRLKPKPHTT